MKHLQEPIAYFLSTNVIFLHQVYRYCSEQSLVSDSLNNNLVKYGKSNLLKGNILNEEYKHNRYNEPII